MASISPSRLFELIGEEAAQRLMAAFGGCAIYVPLPSRINPRGRVASVIGTEALQRLAAAYQREYLMLPRGAAYLRQERDRAIRRERQSMTVAALAAKYRTTERHIHRILAKAEVGVPPAKVP